MGMLSCYEFLVVDDQVAHGNMELVRHNLHRLNERAIHLHELMLWYEEEETLVMETTLSSVVVMRMLLIDQILS